MVAILQAKKYPFDYAANKGKAPTHADYDTLITADTDIYDGDALVCSYRKLPADQLAMLTACTKAAKCTGSARTNGVMQRSAVYGALPRVALREDYCRFSADTKKQPEVFFTLRKVGAYLWQFYKDNYPQVAQNFAAFSEGIHADWRQTGTPFTTVNVNKNFAIGYHKDAANAGGVFSNVLITKRNAAGGYFVMPGFRLALEQAHGALVVVDGVNIPHGVTTIEPLTDNWERSSVVFYTLANLAHCLPKPQEVARMKQKATERARKRAQKIDPRSKPNG